MHDSVKYSSGLIIRFRFKKAWVELIVCNLARKQLQDLTVRGLLPVHFRHILDSDADEDPQYKSLVHCHLLFLGHNTTQVTAIDCIRKPVRGPRPGSRLAIDPKE